MPTLVEPGDRWWELWPSRPWMGVWCDMSHPLPSSRSPMGLEKRCDRHHPVSMEVMFKGLEWLK